MSNPFAESRFSSMTFDQLEAVVQDLRTERDRCRKAAIEAHDGWRKVELLLDEAIAVRAVAAVDRHIARLDAQTSQVTQP